MPSIRVGVRVIRVGDSSRGFRTIYRDAVRNHLCAGLLAGKATRDVPLEFGSAPRRFPESRGEHHVTKRKARSVFPGLYPEDQAAEMEMRSLLLRGLSGWLAESRMTQTEAAKVLAVTQARVSGIKRGKISSFSLDLLVRLAARAGLEPKLKLGKLCTAGCAEVDS
jgi:predicted XRE-type DNA-binding protein